VGAETSCLLISPGILKIVFAFGSGLFLEFLPPEGVFHRVFYLPGPSGFFVNKYIRHFSVFSRFRLARWIARRWEIEGSPAVVRFDREMHLGAWFAARKIYNRRNKKRIVFFLDMMFEPDIGYFFDHYSWYKVIPPYIFHKSISNHVKRMDAINATSSWLKKEVIRVYGVPPRKITTMNINFVPDSWFRSRVHRSYREPLRVLAYGRLTPEKGFRFLLKFLERHQSNLVKHFSFAVVGKGLLATEFENLASRITFKNFLTYHPWLSHEALATRLKKSDIIIVIHQYGGIYSQVLVEPMSFGVVPIAPRIGSFPELVKDGATGFLYRTGDTEDFARALGRALENVKKLRGIGNRARMAARRICRLSKVVDDYRVFFAKQAASRPSL